MKLKKGNMIKVFTKEMPHEHIASPMVVTKLAYSGNKKYLTVVTAESVELKCPFILGTEKFTFERWKKG